MGQPALTTAHEQRRRFRAHLTLQAALDITNFAVTVFTHAWLARRLGVAGWGALAWAEALAAIFNNFGDLGIERALVVFVARTRAEDDRDVRPAVRTALWCRLAVILVLVLLAAGAGELAAQISESALSLSAKGDDGYFDDTLFAMAMALAAATLLHRHMKPILQGLERFGDIAVARLVSTALYIGGLVVLAVTDHVTPSGVIAVSIAQSLALALVCAFYVLRTGRGFIGLPSREGLRDLFGTSAWTFVAVVAVTLFERMDILMLSAMSGVREVGLFSGGRKMYEVLSRSMASFYQVLFPRIAGERDPYEVERLLQVIFRRSVWVAVLLLPVGGFAPLWIPMYLGPGFEGSAFIFQLLFIRFLTQLFVSHFGQVFYRYDRPHLVAYTNIVQMFANLGGNLWLIPLYGAVGAAIATLFTALPALVIYVIGIRSTLAQAKREAVPA